MEKESEDVMPCIACPFNDGITEEATIGQNYGCLPTSQDMIERFDLVGEALSCHENDCLACRGLSAVRKTGGVTVAPYSGWYEGK